MNKLKRPIRTLLAYHEAGHAVAATAAGLPVSHATVVPTPLALGHCGLGCGNRPRTTAGAIVSAAGDAAVILYAGRRGFRVLRTAAASQWNFYTRRLEGIFAQFGLPFDPATGMGPGDAENIAAQATSEDADPALYALGAAMAAGEVLRARWRAVEVIADELVLFGRVEGDRIAQVVSEAARGAQTHRPPFDDTRTVETPRKRQTRRQRKRRVSERVTGPV
jgi:hypothetical protein